MIYGKLNEPAGLDVEPAPIEIKRLVSKCKVDANGCWVWQGHKDAKGYGQQKFRGRAYWAHRLAYAFFRRPLVDGLTVEHKCVNPSCCNPWHLELLPDAENQPGTTDVPF